MQTLLGSSQLLLGEVGQTLQQYWYVFPSPEPPVVGQQL